MHDSIRRWTIPEKFATEMTILVDALIDTIAVLIISIPIVAVLWGMVKCLRDAVGGEDEPM